MTKDKAKFKVSPKGKKKLLFQKKSKDHVKLPLVGKTIFLDVKDLKHQKKLQTDLKRLGATIEEFVSKDINYLITSQPQPKLRKDKKDNETVPSPFNCDPSPSPGNVEDPKASTVTRGKALAEKARINSRETTTMLDNAEKWGVKIVGLDAAYRWIDKANKDFKHQLKDVEKNEKAMQKQRYQNAKFKLLEKPFIKFESEDYNYRPVSEDSLSWPNFDVHTPRGSCPFDGTILKGDDRGDLPAAQVDIPSENTPQEEKDGLDSNSKPTVDSNAANLSIEKGTKKSETEGGGGWKVLTAGELRRRAEQKRRQRKKRGHCECCKMKYEDLDKHVREEQHRLYVKEKSHYQQLDSLIGSVPSTAEFLKRWILASVSKTSQSCTSERDKNVTKHAPRGKRGQNSGISKENQPAITNATRQGANSFSKEKSYSPTKQPLIQDRLENIESQDSHRNENESLNLRRSPRKSCEVSFASEHTLSPRKSQGHISAASPLKILDKVGQSPRKLCSPVKTKERFVLRELSPRKLALRTKSGQQGEAVEQSSAEGETEYNVGYSDKTADFVNDRTTDVDTATTVDVAESPTYSPDIASLDVQYVTEELKSLLTYSKHRANKSGTSDDFEISLIRSLDNIKLPAESKLDNEVDTTNVVQDESDHTLGDSDKENNIKSNEIVSCVNEKEKMTSQQNYHDKKLQDLRRSPRKQSRQEMNSESSKISVEKVTDERSNNAGDCADFSFSNLNSDIPSDFQSFGPQGEILMFSKTLAERIKERGKRRGSVENYNVNVMTQSAMSPSQSYRNSPASSTKGKKISDMLQSVSPNQSTSHNGKSAAVVASRRICKKYKNNRNLNQNKQKGKGNYMNSEEIKIGEERKTDKTNKQRTKKKFWYYEVETEEKDSTKDGKLASLPKIVQDLHNSWNYCKELDKSDSGRKLRRGTRNYYREIDHLSQALALRNSNSLNVEINDCSNVKRNKGKQTKVSKKGSDQGLVSAKSNKKSGSQIHDISGGCNQVKPKQMDKIGEKLGQYNTVNGKKDAEKTKPKQRRSRFWEYVIDSEPDQDMELDQYDTVESTKNEEEKPKPKQKKSRFWEYVIDKEPGQDKEVDQCDTVDSTKNEEEKPKTKQKQSRFWEYVIDKEPDQEKEEDVSLHRELKILKEAWNTVSVDTKRRSRSVDVNYRVESVERRWRKETRISPNIEQSNINDNLRSGLDRDETDKEMRLRKETKMSSKADQSNINEEFKSGLDNDKADKFEKRIPVDEGRKEVETHSGDGENLEPNKDKEMANPGMQQKQKRRYWDYVIEAEPEVTEVDENLPKELRNLHSPWFNIEDNSNTKRRSRSMDVNYRETINERALKLGRGMYAEPDKEVDNGKSRKKSSIKKIQGTSRNEGDDRLQIKDKNHRKLNKSEIERNDTELIESRRKFPSQETVSKHENSSVKHTVMNLETHRSPDNEENLNKDCENVSSNTNDKIDEVKSGQKAVNNFVPIVSPKKVEISRNKKEQKNNEGSMEYHITMTCSSVNSRHTDEDTVVVDLQSPGKLRFKGKSIVKNLDKTNTGDCDKIDLETRSTSPVFNKSPAGKVCKKRISNKVTLKNNERGKDSVEIVHIDERDRASAQGKVACLDTKSLRSPRKCKTPVKSPESMLISSPRSGYSTSPRESRRKKWKRRPEESTPNSQGVKRRRLDKLKYIIEPDKSNVSGDKSEIAPSKSVTMSEESETHISVSDRVSSKVTVKDSADSNVSPRWQPATLNSSSVSLKWQPVTLNSSACEENKKVKLNKSWTLISDRSASKLLDSEDEDRQSFNGFTEDEVENTHPSDLSYEEHSEVELLSSDHEWSVEEESTTEKDEEFSKFVPSFSSPGKPSETDWEVNVDSFMKNRVSDKNQSCLSVTSPWRSPRRKSWNTMASPSKITPVKKRTSNFLNRLNGSDNDTNSGSNLERETVDDEIEFNHRSPQKFKSNFSPLRAEKGVIVGHARKHVTSTPNHIKNPKSRDKNFSGLVFNFDDSANIDLESNVMRTVQDYRILKKKSDTPKRFSLKFEASPEKKKKKSKISSQA